MSAKKPTTMLGHVATRRVQETYNSDSQQLLFVHTPNLTDRIDDSVATLKVNLLKLAHESTTHVRRWKPLDYSKVCRCSL
jgi:hypothetical protein